MAKNDDGEAHAELFEQIARSLHELVAWTRVMAYPTVKQSLETVLDSDKKRLVYDLFDGQRSVAEIQELTGVNVRYISKWGQEWEAIGIVEQSRVSKVRGRRMKLFNLTAFGIPIAGNDRPDEGGN